MSVHISKVQGTGVARFLDHQIRLDDCRPQRLQVDNGSELIDMNLDHWAYEHNIALGFSRLSKPIDNPYIEKIGPFNGKLCDECFLLNRFMEMAGARQKIEV